MTEKFTPGPWFWNERTESIGSPAGWVAAVGESHRERKSDVPLGDLKADAALIAAAPDLYVAAADTLDHLTDALCYPDDDPLVEDLRAALAKARGEQ